MKLNSVSISKYILLSASIIFYALWKVEFVLQFIILIFINYNLSKLILGEFSNKLDHKKDRISVLAFTVSLIINLGFLFYYKYLIFFMSQSNELFGTTFVLEKIIMPLGISFFTFIQISYLIECFQKRVTQAPSLLDYMQFVTYFPHLIAGPIVLYKELIPQFNDSTRHKTVFKNIALGLFLFSIGMFKKVVIADSLDEHTAIAFDEGGIRFYRTWISALSFTLQLYFDFSGYMDMALGISKMFNYDLPINFNSPFKSLNISEYWRKWHITMTRFFMGYVYLPVTLSATRKYNDCKRPIIKFFNITIYPIVLTFLIAGIWHGAGWTFIIFGLWHGIGLAIHRVWQLTKLNLGKYISWMITFIFVVIGNVFFRSPDMSTAFIILDSMFYTLVEILLLKNPELGHASELSRLAVFVIGLAIVLLFKNSSELAQKFKPNLKHFAFTVILLVFIIKYDEQTNRFFILAVLRHV